MFLLPYLQQYSLLSIAQIGLTIWMLVDAHRRRVDQYWFWMIIIFQPLGPWAYFAIYKLKELRGLDLSNLFHRQATLDELCHRVEQRPTPANWLELSERLMEVDRHDLAVPHLESVLKREPEHCRALFLLAVCHRRLNRPDQSIVLLKLLVKRQPGWTDYEGWRALIAVQLEGQDPAGAVSSCRDLARASPGLQHRCLLAQCLVAAGEKEEARKVVQQGLDDYRYLTSRSRRRDRPWLGQARQFLRQDS